MSSTSTTESTGAKVATSEKPKTGKGKSTANTATQYELLPQEEATDNGSPGSTAEMVSSRGPEGPETVTKKVVAAATKSKPKKVEAVAAKAKTKKVEVAAAKTKPKKAEAAAAKSKPENVAQKKAVSNVKSVSVNGKKIKLAASTYHYYRNWLAEFMRSHGVPSAKFQKSPTSYEGHIMISETEKAKGLKALEQWSKQNPDTKELFWDVKK